ncbi:hypothetical protein [Mycolicibacterium phlei]|uniref:hypothetical protein n=1 Tax=Mycolicibacterium phlei TaxID=1771 RepID=UPI00058F22BA|nr:hypothetical protein [Mycolicibacterium phlei]MBF4194572.1 hypothetical protein [Mycolicibacterium phlei]
MGTAASPTSGLVAAGVARLVEKGSDDDHCWFVFSVTSLNEREVKFLRKTGWYDSFGSVEYDGGLHEVEKVVVERYEWRPV